MKQWLLYTKKQLILPKMSNICTCRSKSGLFCFLYAHRIKGVKKRSYNFVHLFESRACADYKRYIWVFIWNVSAACMGEPPLCMSCSALFVIQHAIEAFRRDIGKDTYLLWVCKYKKPNMDVYIIINSNIFTF